VAKVKVDIDGKDNASGAVNSVTKSMRTAMLQVEGLKMAAKAMVGFTKDAIEKFKEQERVETQLNSVLKSTKNAAGLTATQIKNMATELQGATKFGDEAILNSQNLLLTFTKIGGDVFPQATEAILNMSEAMGQDLKTSTIQMGKALNDPVAGISALSRVGVQLSDDQKNMIKSFMDVNDTANAQKIILGELETQFGGSARAAAETFGGKLEQLKNVNGDVMESFGRIVSVVGKDLVGGMVKGATAFNNFISAPETIASISAGFMVFFDTIKELGTFLKDTFTPVFDTIKEAFGKFSDGLNEGVGASEIFSVVLETVKGAIKILGVYINDVSTNLINLVTVIISSGQTVGDFFLMLAGKKSWADVKKQASETGDAIKTFAKGLAGSYVNIVATTIDVAKKMPEEVKKSADKMAKNYKNKFNEVVAAQKSQQEKLTEEVSDGEKKRSEIISEKAKENLSTFTSVFSQIGGAVSSGLSAAGELMNTIFQNMTDNIQANMQRQLEAIDARTQGELELLGLADLSKQEMLKREIEQLQLSAAQTTDIEEKKNLKIQLSDKQAELQKQIILDKSEQEKEKIMKKAAKKEHALKVSQYRANLGIKAATASIQFATGLVSAWAGAMQLGPIAGAIVGAVLSGLLTGVYAANMATIYSQSPPSASFAEGGIVPGSSMAGDRVNVMANSGEAVLMKRDFNFLVDQIRGGGVGNGGITITGPVTIQTNDPKDFIDQLVKLQRKELARV